MVSCYGDIFDLLENRAPSVFADNQGYLRTHVKSKSNDFIMISIHRIVKIEFDGIDNDPEKNIVDHVDADKNNIHITNLDWVTQQENTYRAIRKGLYCVEFVLEESDVPSICQMLKEGKSYKEISDFYYPKYQRDIMDIIGKIYRGERWKHISKNYMPFPVLRKSLIIPEGSFYTEEIIHRICYLYDQEKGPTEIARIIKEEYSINKTIREIANSIGAIKTKNRFFEISKNYNFKKVK